MKKAPIRTGNEEVNLNVNNLKLVNKRKPRVLIVEDDMEYQPIWTSLLLAIHPNVRVDWVVTSLKAEAKIHRALQKGYMFDLIIADIFLEDDRSGLDLWLKYGSPMENMIVVSGMDYRKVLRYLGPESDRPIFFQKPLNWSQCAKTIRNYIL